MKMVSSLKEHRIGRFVFSPLDNKTFTPDFLEVVLCGCCYSFETFDTGSCYVLVWNGVEQALQQSPAPAFQDLSAGVTAVYHHAWLDCAGIVKKDEGGRALEHTELTSETNMQEQGCPWPRL